MSCGDIIGSISMLECGKDFNIELLKVDLSAYDKVTRKAIGLLAKQYTIEGWEIRDAEYCESDSFGRIIIAPQQIQINYCSSKNPNKKFKWIIDEIRN